jgi:hypothetical protein
MLRGIFGDDPASGPEKDKNRRREFIEGHENRTDIFGASEPESWSNSGCRAEGLKADSRWRLSGQNRSAEHSNQFFFTSGELPPWLALSPQKKQMLKF